MGSVHGKSLFIWPTHNFFGLGFFLSREFHCEKVSNRLFILCLCVKCSDFALWDEYENVAGMKVWYGCKQIKIKGTMSRKQKAESRKIH